MLVIALIGILSVAFLVRLRDVQAAAERAAVSSALDSLQAGLWAAAATRMVGEGEGGVVRLAGENPFLHLQARIPGYSGAWLGAGTGAPGSWFFDVKNLKIVYLPRFHDNFFMDGDKRNVVEFQIVLYDSGGSARRGFNGIGIAGDCACAWLKRVHRS